MREILFRGKRLDNGEWVEGFLVKDTEFYGKPENHTYIVNHKHPSGGYGQDIFLEVDPTTVGQYTGLKDKNGKRIFEGDVLKNIDGNPVGEPIVAKVVPNLNDYELMWDIEHSYELEIIGNIHDNPELLE